MINIKFKAKKPCSYKLLKITIGKKWGAWYDVVYGTNNSFVWDGNAADVYTYNKDDGAVNSRHGAMR